MTSAEDADRSELVEEDLAFLTSTGLRDGGELARRLGFTNAEAMDRYLYRHRIPVTYYKPKPETGVKIKVSFDQRKSHAHQYERNLANTPEQIRAAARVTHRQLQHDPSSVPEVLAMLGLPPEQQLAS